MTVRPQSVSTRWLSYGVHSDRGLVRVANEDAFLVEEIEDPKGGPAGLLVAIADGMGGFGPGLLASREALEVVHARVVADQGTEQPAEVLRQAVLEANRRLHSACCVDGRRVGTGTTLTVCWFHRGRCVLANVGDSRGYCLRDGRIQRLTSDHSLDDLLRRHGGDDVIPEGTQIARMPLRLLGTHASVPVDVQQWKMTQGDRILLATDGITDVVPDPLLSEWLEREDFSPQLVAQAIVDGSLELGSRDNATAIVVEFCESSVSAPKKSGLRGVFTVRAPAGMIPSGKETLRAHADETTIDENGVGGVAANRGGGPGPVDRITGRVGTHWYRVERNPHDLPRDRASETRKRRLPTSGWNLRIPSEGNG